MNAFQLMAENEYGEAHFCLDQESGLRSIVAIHDTQLGPGLGGCRFIHYESERAALIDALRLARAMTFKAALARLAHGGGKAVILKPKGDFDRRALLTRFAKFVDDLGGRYITTEDSGTSPADMEIVRATTRHVCGFSVESGGSGDPSPFTALGVRRGIEACVHVKLGRDDLEGLHVAVQGVGNVGYHLCKELKNAGVRLTVADVSEERVERARAEFGASTVGPDEVHRVDCDVYAPCALGSALNDRTVRELSCRIVAGAANNQLASDAEARALAERDILYAPDYAINAGGLINVALEVIGYDEEAATERTLEIYDTILEISERSVKTSELPSRIADAMVREILRARAA